LLDHRGKWVVSQNNNIVQVDHVVESNYNIGYATAKRVITGFTLTDSKGYKYIFGTQREAIEFSDFAQPTGLEAYNEGNVDGPAVAMLYMMMYRKTTAPNTSFGWHLWKIISPAGEPLYLITPLIYFTSLYCILKLIQTLTRARDQGVLLDMCTILIKQISI
jgi:hypothetical protein